MGNVSIFVGRDETRDQNTEKERNGLCQRSGGCLKGKIPKETVADSLGKEGHFFNCQQRERRQRIWLEESIKIWIQHEWLRGMWIFNGGENLRLFNPIMSKNASYSFISGLQMEQSWLQDLTVGLLYCCWLCRGQFLPSINLWAGDKLGCISRTRHTSDSWYQKLSSKAPQMFCFFMLVVVFFIFGICYSNLINGICLKVAILMIKIRKCMPAWTIFRWGFISVIRSKTLYAALHDNMPD